MQNMLLGKADRTKYLMSDTGAFRRSFSATNFRRGRFEERRFVKILALGKGVSGRSRRCERSCRFASEPREVLLDCLEFPDRALEGDALIGIRDGQRQNGLDRAGNLYAAAYGAHEHQGRTVETARCARVTQGPHPLEADDV